MGSRAEITLEPAVGRQRSIVISGTEGQARCAMALLREVAGSAVRLKDDFTTKIESSTPKSTLARFAAEMREPEQVQTAAQPASLQGSRCYSPCHDDEQDAQDLG